MSDTCTFETLAQVLETGHDGENKPLAQALNAALAEISAACINANAKASLTLVLGCEPSGSDQLKLTAKLTTKTPQPGALPVRLFLDRAGNLVAEDPDQQKLPLESIDGGRKERNNAA